MSATISNSNQGLIVQYDFCTGCHACEVACKKERGLDKGEFGIKVMEYGPAKKPDGRWDYFFIPYQPTCATYAPTAQAWASYPPACTTAKRKSWNTATLKSSRRN